MFVSFLVILVCISLFHVESIQAEDTDPDYPQHTVPIQVEWHGEGGDTSQRPSIIYVDFESENEDKRSPLQGSNWTETAYIKKFNDDGSQINYTIQVSADPVTPYWYTVEGSVETGLTVHATKVDIINVPI
ncbi:MAG: Cna B-type domain-containing protein, partial [Eubacteriales bacterium]|nr:Cna B-type domain-containing protein [Eubacteriales bacterium]